MVNDLGNTTAYAINNGGVAFPTGKEDVRLLLFTLSSALSPDVNVKLANQDLHGIEETELLIVYHKDFEEAAKKFTTIAKSTMVTKWLWQRPNKSIRSLAVEGQIPAPSAILPR